MIDCGGGVTSTKAISFAEVMESRCRTSAEVVAQAPSARDAEKIEKVTTSTAPMF